MSHYCKICGEYKSNESFSGRGHAAHICKKCAKLPKEVRDERTTLNRIYELPFRLSKANRSWLEKLKADPREAVRTAAESEWNMRFQRRTTVTETEEEYMIAESVIKKLGRKSLPAPEVKEIQIPMGGQ